MKYIEVSDHASKRAEERGLKEEWAGEVIHNPDETIIAKFGRYASYRRIGEDYVVVIYEEKIDKLVVVTLLKVDKERLERYGFHRVR